jgi:hypothetical protein
MSSLRTGKPPSEKSASAAAWLVRLAAVSDRARTCVDHVAHAATTTRINRYLIASLITV